MSDRRQLLKITYMQTWLITNRHKSRPLLGEERNLSSIIIPIPPRTTTLLLLQWLKKGFKSCHEPPLPFLSPRQILPRTRDWTLRLACQPLTHTADLGPYYNTCILCRSTPYPTILTIICGLNSVTGLTSCGLIIANSIMLFRITCLRASYIIWLLI